MEVHDHAFWDELGVVWRASVPDKDLFRSRLERRLRLQAFVQGAAMSATAGATLFGFGLGAWTVWIGWSSGAWHFVIRGATLIAAACLTLLASIVLRSRDAGESRSVRQSLELSITRTERLAKAVNLLVAAVAAIGLGGLVGYAVRAHYGRPAFVSPIEDLLALAVLALALLWFRWGQSRSLEATRHIFNSTVDVDDGPERPPRVETGPGG